LIEAYSRVAKLGFPAKLRLIGEELDRHYVQSLQRRVADLGLQDRVAFTPPLPQAELAKYVANSAVFVLPTYSEGLPRVVFEAMAARTPVIASAVSGIPEIIRNGDTGFLVPPGDEEALAARIVAVLRDPATSRRMAERGRDVAIELFSTQRYVDGYRRLFHLATQALDGVRGAAN
jgi:glycosyltransferase involved in cell wall biosynthesis